MVIFKKGLSLMTLNREPCQLVPIWLMTLPAEPYHTGGVLMVATLYKMIEKTFS